MAERHNMGNGEPRSITINVETSQDSNTFEENERFFKRELKEAQDLIEYLADPKSKRVPAPIAIFGRRGAGKSSFLKALEKHYNEQRAEHDIVPIGVLDANRIKQHEVFLVTVVTLILECLKKMQKNQEHPTYREEVADSLQELSLYFSVLVPGKGVTERDRTESAVTFAQRVLADSKAGLNLPDSLSTFVETALKTLNGKKALLLLIDDTDVLHERCIDVLETIRKYLFRTRGLITVVAVDEELLELQVARDNLRWAKDLADLEKTLGEDLSLSAHSTAERYRAQSYVLKEQYLCKVLPQHQRLHLPSMASRLRTSQAAELAIILTDGSADRDCYLSRKPQEDGPLKPKKDALEPLCNALGCNRDMALSYLPDSSRSLVRLCHLLHRIVNEREVPDLLADLDYQFRTARVAVGVRGWLLRELREGKGDLALAEWVINQSVHTPRTFSLSRDPYGQGDERRLVPALLHGSWVRGCRNNQRADAFLAYGLRVVLPAYQVERAGQDRADVARELLYRLKPSEPRDCASTVGRLLAWQSNRDKKSESSAVNGAHKPGVTDQVARTMGELSVPNGSDEAGEFSWYRQIGNRSASFFMGLARVADLCALWSANRSLKEAERIQSVHNYIKDLASEHSQNAPTDCWLSWLKLFDILYQHCPKEFQVLPARVIGEIFVLLHNHWYERVAEEHTPSEAGGDGSPGEVKPEAYIFVLWYALITLELSWRRGEPELTRPKGLYAKVEGSDVKTALEGAKAACERQNDLILVHSLIWLTCPLFTKQLDTAAASVRNTRATYLAAAAGLQDRTEAWANEFTAALQNIWST